MKEALRIVHPNAAGIDVGSRSFFVNADEDVKTFPTYTEGCHAVRDYLLSRGVKTVAMESTGVYWCILYAVLEEAGLDVWLVNGRHVRNVPGRKSDVKDCQWLRQLHSYGLLTKSFIPDENVRRLRAYVRLRQDHIRARATQVHLMQKALTLMNVRLAEVLNDIAGASGIAIIEAILNGERSPDVLVELCHTTVLKHKREQVRAALVGDYRAEHLFALRQAHQTWRYYQSLIDDCDAQMEACLKAMSDDKPDVPSSGKRKPIRSHKPDIDELHKPLLKLTGGADPTTIAGLTDYTFLQLVSEVGCDMNAWQTEKQFVSWLKLAPQKSSSGNVTKRLRGKQRHKAGQLFKEAAQGLLTSKHIALGAFGRRIRARRGSAVAVKAIARKIACYYYRVMTKGEAFLEKGIAWYEQHLKERSIKALERMATKHNFQLIPVTEQVCP